MNSLVREWIDLAEGDYATANREAQVTQNPNHAAICFHAQQCIEKLLKALLTLHLVEFEKTHDLELLSGIVQTRVAPTWKPPPGSLDVLQSGAVEFRYPGSRLGHIDARDALEACAGLREPLLCMLGVKTTP